MRNKIYAYLKLRQEGAISKELVEQVLKIKGAPSHVCEKLIQTAIGGDRRFTINELHYWKIVERKGTPLSETELVFLSLLAIDTIEKPRTIVEVSAQKLRDNKITDRLHLFINPSLSTGSLSNLPPDLAQEIKGGVSVEKAVDSLLNFFGDAILVGYDIQFAMNQLNMILNRLNKGIENPSLCIKYLTKKLVPDPHLKSLDDMAAYFKLPIMDTQRTENEVSTIVEIFSSYKELLKKRGLNTLEEVLEFQYPDTQYVDFSKYAFDKGFLWAIPQKPGIYKMKNKRDEVVYVGKAKNLRVRVSSYFWNTAERLQKITDLLDTIYTIEYEVAGSELAAMLMEFRLIKQYQPKLNQQLEVHERATRYGNLKNFIVILPSSIEGCLELFFIRDRLPLQRYEILKNAVNFSGIEKILDQMYYEEVSIPFYLKGNKNIQNGNTLTDIEMGEIDLVLSWVKANKDQVNYINMETICSKESCLKLLKDYIHDEETFRKHFRSF